MKGEPENSAPIVRPYARTGGRTRSSVYLPLEALVLTRGVADENSGSVAPQHQEIAVLCREIRSVAEVAALLTMPLGVARVLIGDMAELGLVTVHRTGSDENGEPDLPFLERVLSGLRRL